MVVIFTIYRIYPVICSPWSCFIYIPNKQPTAEPPVSILKNCLGRRSTLATWPRWFFPCKCKRLEAETHPLGKRKHIWQIHRHVQVPVVSFLLVCVCVWVCCVLHVLCVCVCVCHHSENNPNLYLRWIWPPKKNLSWGQFQLEMTEKWTVHTSKS